MRGVKPHQAAGSETAKSRPLTIQQKKPGGAILFYHRVAMLSPDPHALCIAPDLFRAHMRHLRDHYKLLALNDLVAGMKNQELPERAIAVTLDDGYLDALEVAAPVLEELGIPATFFISTDRLHEEHETWQDTLIRSLFSDALLPHSLSISYKGRTLLFPTFTYGERKKALEEINALCWNLSFEGRSEIIASVCRWSGLDFTPRKTHRLITAAEVCRLADRRGISIGCHGIHHLCLPAQPLPIQQREVVESKYNLESLLKKPVGSFSYPYGVFDHQAEAVVRSAGFDSAFTTREGLIYPGDNLWRLARNEVGAWPLSRFSDWLHRIFSLDGNATTDQK